MMARPSGSIRIGPVSIFALIILISLAVMAVLTITTADAARALADKQAVIVQTSYANEKQAQRFLSQMDAVLNDARLEGKSRSETLRDVELILPEGASLAGNVVQASFATGDVRSLAIEVAITDDLHVTVNAWRGVTEWVPETSNLNLWPGR